jgi:hypothetical protein
MIGAVTKRWRIAAAVLVLGVLAAGAQAATPATPAPEKGPIVLRGPQAVDKPAPAARPAPSDPAVDPAIGPAPLTELSPVPRFLDQPAPRFGGDPAPRVGGLDLLGGGAACRTACAESRYQCRAGDLPDQCDGAWGQCVASCAESSSAPL